MKTIKNNYFLFSYILKICPLYALYSWLYIAILGLTSYTNLILLEKIIDLFDQTTFYQNKLIIYLLIMIIINVISLIFNNFYNVYIKIKYKFTWSAKVSKYIYCKTKVLDLECYDNPKIFDKLSRAIKNSESKILQSYDELISFISNFIIALSTGFYIVKSNYILIFIIIVQTIISFILYSYFDKKWYDVSCEQEINERKIDYFKRIFYVNNYKNEIYTTKISELLLNLKKETTKIINKGYEKAENTYLKVSIFEDIVFQFVNNFLSYLCLLSKLFNNIITMGSFVSSINAINKFSSTIYGLTFDYVQIKENSLYIEDFIWIIKYKPNIELSGNCIIEKDINSINLSNCNFQYNENIEILKNINFSIKKNNVFGIVGVNGAGKSTLLKLILKFYVTKNGILSANNMNYIDIYANSIRENIYYLSQEINCYSITFLQFVVGKEEIKDEELKKLNYYLKELDLYEKVYNSTKGIYNLMSNEFDEDGFTFSGGEIQKINILKALMSNKSVIIMDEHTSALDSLSEQKVNRLIKSLNEKLIIIITHRLEPLKICDRIYLLENGFLSEIGTYDDFIQNNKIPYELRINNEKM